VLYNAQWAGISEGILLSYGGWADIQSQLLSDPKNHAFHWIELPLTEQDTHDTQRLAAILQSSFLLLSSQWILDRNVIKELCHVEKDPEGGILIQASASYPREVLPPASLLDGPKHPDIAAALLKGGDIREIAALLRTRSVTRTEHYAPPELIPVHTKDDRKEAEEQLFKGLIKPSESFISRFVERRISLAISRRIIYTSLTPNQISIFSILLGLLSGLLFLTQHRTLHVTGAILLLISSIIDGCDGEIARLRYQESRLGSWMDFLGDNCVHMCVFFCIGMGLYRQGHGTVYLILGIIAVMGTLGSASMVFYRVFIHTKGRVVTFATPVRLEEMERAGGDIRRRIDFADKISNRDFIWIILVFSILGWLWFWAWICAVGVMFYFFNLLNLYLKMRSRPSAYH
jgi:phosphatidylglycerophosphate synthase